MSHTGYSYSQKYSVDDIAHAQPVVRAPRNDIPINMDVSWSGYAGSGNHFLQATVWESETTLPCARKEYGGGSCSLPHPPSGPQLPHGGRAGEDRERSESGPRAADAGPSSSGVGTLERAAYRACPRMCDFVRSVPAGACLGMLFSPCPCAQG